MTLDNIEVIDNPLEWQAMIDKAGESGHGTINMRGSARFWATVIDRGVEVIYRNGAPEFSRIVIYLGGGVGLELSTDGESQHIDYRFVDATKSENNHAVEDSE